MRKRTLGVDHLRFPDATRHLPLDFETLTEEDQLDLLERNHWQYVRQGLPFGRRMAFMKADEYALPVSDWPEEMAAAFHTTKPAEKEKWNPLRGFDQGKRDRDPAGNVIKAKNPWRSGTSEYRQHQLTYLLGFWHRPRSVTDLPPMIVRSSHPSMSLQNAFEETETEEKSGFAREGGLGIPTCYIKPALFALNHLVLAYAYWKTRRSGMYVRSIPNTLKVIAPMLQPETGVVWKSPGMLKDLEAFVEWWQDNPHETIDARLIFDITPFQVNWQKAVEEAYELMLDDIALASDGELKPSRDTMLQVGVFLDDEAPMTRYMVGVRTLLAARPRQIQATHLHTRDCVQTLLLIQTGLRTYNMMFTIDPGIDEMPSIRRRARGSDKKILEPTLRRSIKAGTVRWTIKIPSSEFKNWYSPFFEGDRPYEKVLDDEDDLYDHLERYTSRARPYFLAGRKSDALFVSTEGNDMDEISLANAYRRITGRYFIANPRVHDGGVEGAMVHGMHAVRHVIATHIVKVTGSVHAAAWAIQDSPQTVEKHYAKYIPADKIRHADKILAAARAIQQ